MVWMIRQKSAEDIVANTRSNALGMVKVRTLTTGRRYG